jgi:hypothetical protein
MKWWAQSFIVGIPKIVVGYRDDDVNYLLKPMDQCYYQLKLIVNVLGGSFTPRDHGCESAAKTIHRE